VNIATFHLGRRTAGGEAVALVSVDGQVPPAVIGRVAQLPGVRRAVPLRF
jgi:D-3-phosphoglycerate dehydrogenase